MGYIIRRYLTRKPYDPYKENTKKFKDETIRLFFYELNSALEKNEKIRELYGFYCGATLGPISQQFSEQYSKLKKMSSGKFNAYAELYAVNSEQLYRSPIGKKNDSTITNFTDVEIKTCAEENCKKFVEIINQTISTLAIDKSKIFANMEAVLMNKEFDAIKYPGYGALYTSAIIKFKYKDTSAI